MIFSSLNSPFPCVVQGFIELAIPLPEPPECQAYRCDPSCLALILLSYFSQQACANSKIHLYNVWFSILFKWLKYRASVTHASRPHGVERV